MNEEQKKCLIDAMMILEVAFFDGGPENWQADPLYREFSQGDMAAMAHGLIQFAHSGYANLDYEKAKMLVANTKARMAIEDAQESSRRDQ